MPCCSHGFVRRQRAFRSAKRHCSIIRQHQTFHTQPFRKRRTHARCVSYRDCSPALHLADFGTYDPMTCLQASVNSSSRASGMPAMFTRPSGSRKIFCRLSASI